MMSELRRVGVVGARGHVGGELLRLLIEHPRFELSYVGSRKLAGRHAAEDFSGAPSSLVYCVPSPASAAEQGLDAVILALPNGHAAAYADALPPRTVIVDLSADYRFDGAWAYGLVERNRKNLKGARRIANPGCYATAAQLALAPLLSLLSAPPSVFGVSGYSGAGTAASRRNDPEVLRDNLLAYAPVQHTHEREISRHLGREVRFSPHVASFFRGIHLTIHAELLDPLSTEQLQSRYLKHYEDEPLVQVSDKAPEVRDVVGKHCVCIGGMVADGRRVVLSATIDNLLKGAATQAIQNLNLACGYREVLGLIEPAGSS